MAQKFIKSDFECENTSMCFIHDCPIRRAIKRLFNVHDAKVYTSTVEIQYEDSAVVKHWIKTIRLNGKTISNRHFGYTEFMQIYNAFMTDENTVATFSISKRNPDEIHI